MKVVDTIHKERGNRQGSSRRCLGPLALAMFQRAMCETRTGGLSIAGLRRLQRAAGQLQGGSRAWARLRNQVAPWQPRRRNRREISILRADAVGHSLAWPRRLAPAGTLLTTFVIWCGQLQSTPRSPGLCLDRLVCVLTNCHSVWLTVRFLVLSHAVEELN